MKYNYTSKNHFKFPEKYQMTPFHNIDFLKAYKNSRESNLILLKKKDSLICEFSDIFALTSFNVESQFSNKIGNEIINTEKLLCFLLIEFIKDKKKYNKILDILIKKFEIKKRIFEFYDSEFKESKKEYSNLNNYILLSLICLLKFEKTHNLKFLNTSLKLNDTISSQIKKLISSKDTKLYSFVIKKELEFVSQLCSKKKVNFCE